MLYVYENNILIWGRSIYDHGCRLISTAAAENEILV